MKQLTPFQFVLAVVAIVAAKIAQAKFLPDADSIGDAIAIALALVISLKPSAALPQKTP